MRFLQNAQKIKPENLAMLTARATLGGSWSDIVVSKTVCTQGKHKWCERQRPLTVSVFLISNCRSATKLGYVAIQTRAEGVRVGE